MLVGLTMSAGPALEVSAGSSAAGVSYSARPALYSSGNVKKIRARLDIVDMRTASAALDTASKHFTSTLMDHSEPLGYEFASVLEENFLDLLIT